jgi:TRAP-type mannitol/chloroaromatic compound transport system permease small subunit
VNDYETLLILLLFIIYNTNNIDDVFTSFISDQKSALLFSIALYFFINIFMASYYLVKYATDITPYVLFTLPICLPTALYNWDEIYAQARIAYNEISGVITLCQLWRNTVHFIIILSHQLFLSGVEINLRKRVSD